MWAVLRPTKIPTCAHPIQILRRFATLGPCGQAVNGRKTSGRSSPICGARK